MESSRWDADELREFAAKVLVQVDMPPEDAQVCGDAMVWAAARGIVDHGIGKRLPQLVKRIQAGAVNPRPRWSTLADRPALVLIDADGAWGQVAGTRAMRLAIARAGEAGSAAVVTRNADVTSAMGWYVNLAIEAGMIGLAINNTVPLMAPTGGAGKVLGNQAFAIGAPSVEQEPPLLFDAAVAAMSHSGIRGAQERGEPLPADVALTEHGEPTTDHAEALTGMLLPMGGHRGYGLALLWEVLTGVLGGGRMAPDVGGLGEPAALMGISVFCLAVDPSVFGPLDGFHERVGRLADTMRAVTPTGDEPVRVPGERQHRILAESTAKGIALSRPAVVGLQDLGRNVGVAWPPERPSTP